MSDTKATISFTDGTPSVDFPIYKGSIGPDVIDIRKLFGQTGKFTFDPGFMSTAACESKFTYIDGDQGELLYRGYPIEQVAVQCDYLETCYLLLNGELPNRAQRDQFVGTVTKHTMVHEQMQRFFQGFRRDAHPMAVLVGVVGALAAFYHDSLDINNPAHREISAIRLIAKMPTLVAMAYKYSIGQPFMYPQNSLSYSANFMRMMFGNPCEAYEVNDVLVRALDRILILHADHEQNASTSTVRLAGSSGANPFACIAAGIATLWGPAHGGANEACLVMLNDIQKMGGVEKIGEFIKQVKDKQSTVKLMGFGHRVYKNYDPRAKLMRETCHEVLGELGLDGSLAAVAGILPAAVAAHERGLGLICPAASGAEAAWAAADLPILAPRSLIQLATHFKGTQILSRPAPAIRKDSQPLPDMAELKGQDSARRALVRI